MFQSQCIAMKVEIDESSDCYFLLSLIFSLKSETQRYSVFERTQPALLNKQIQAGQEFLLILVLVFLHLFSDFDLSTIDFLNLIFYSTQCDIATMSQLSCWNATVVLKGKLGEFFLYAQSFYRTLTKRKLNGQFSPKSPEVGQKSGQRVQKLTNKNQKANSYCRNPPNLGQQLL